jgi:protein phosphatase PTC1
MIVRFDNNALRARRTEASIGVQGDAATGMKGESEADALVESVKRQIDETGEVPPMVEANKQESAGGGGDVMADIEEEGEEEGEVPELNEEPLEEAREKARAHGGGS